MTREQKPDGAVEFEVGVTYPHRTGTYEVLAIEGEWLTCRLADGSEVRVTERNARRALEESAAVSASPGAGGPGGHDRLQHECEGGPCGPACVKLAGTVLDENHSHEGSAR